MWTGVGIIVILCSTSLADPQGDSKYLSGDFRGLACIQQVMIVTHQLK